MTAAFLESVVDLHDRGFALVPVPLGLKRPLTHGWQDLRLDGAGVKTAFRDRSNVGVLLGEPSNGLTDVDLDCPEARALASHFLPPTGLRSGRASAPASHAFYRVRSPLKTVRFRDPLVTSGDDRGMLIELRSTGTQTLVPPSVHPSGEEIVWANAGEPAEVEMDTLQRAVARIAAGALLVRAWPTAGSRHEGALALAGGLLRAGWEAQEAADFIWHIAMTAGDDEADDRRRAVLSTAAAIAAGQLTTGWPTLATLLDQRVVDQVRTWLGISHPPGSPPVPHQELGFEASLEPPPPFPVDVFPPMIATFVHQGSAAFGIPPDFIAIPLLGFAAGVIGNLRTIELKPGWTERAILWVGIVGRPGSGKSPGMDYAQQLIGQLQQRAWSTYQTEMETWQASQHEGKGGTRSARVRMEPPTLESFYTTDATIEAIAALADAAPGVCMIRDELVGWVKAHDAYRQAGDRQTWLSLWAGSSLKIDRKTAAPLFIPSPTVSVAGGLQPERLPDLRDAASRDDGFVDRLLLGWPEAPATMWTDAVVEHGVVRDAERIFTLLRHRTDGARRHVSLTRFDDRARSRFIAWHDDNAGIVSQGHGLTSGWAAKYPRQVARVALVLHALHYPDAPLHPVTVEIVDGAIAVIEYFRGHLPPILARLGPPGSVAGSAGLVSRVAALLREVGDGWVSRTDLHAGLGRNVSAIDLSQALNQLEAEGMAKQRAVPTEGRTREEWRLRRNEETKKGPADPVPALVGHPSFVTSFVREEDAPNTATCCICGVPLPPGRRYQCEPCAQDGVRRNDLRFLREDP